MQGVVRKKSKNSEPSERKRNGSTPDPALRKHLKTGSGREQLFRKQVKSTDPLQREMSSQESALTPRGE